jgi:hypothetical protein
MSGCASKAAPSNPGKLDGTWGQDEASFHLARDCPTDSSLISSPEIYAYRSSSSASGDAQGVVAWLGSLVRIDDTLPDFNGIHATTPLKPQRFHQLTGSLSGLQLLQVPLDFSAFSPTATTIVNLGLSTCINVPNGRSSDLSP